MSDLDLSAFGADANTAGDASLMHDAAEAGVRIASSIIPVVGGDDLPHSHIQKYDR